jgi:hypothetical protein
MARIIRIEAEQRTRRGGYLTDLRTGQGAFIHRGEDLIIELALFSAGRMLLKSEVTTLTLKFYNSAAVLVLQTIVANTDLNPAMTAAQWRNGTAALARLSITGANTGTLPAGYFTMEVWSNEGGLGDAMFANGLIEGVTVANLTTSTPASPAPPTAYTKGEADALYDFKGAFRDAGMSNATKLLTRTAHNTGPAGGTQALTGAPSPSSAGTILGNEARVSTVTVGANTAIYLPPPGLAVGASHTLLLQQGYVAHWDAIFAFPPFTITNGTGAAGFAKKSWHPATGETYDRFHLLYDGTSVHVSRFRQPALPPSIYDWQAEAPLHNGTNFVADRTGRTMLGTIGTPGYAAMAGSVFKGVTYNGTNSSHSMAMEAPVVAQGMTVAMVFTATASTAQNVLFSSSALGIQIVTDTDGVRLQPYGALTGEGLRISTSYSAAPVAFVAVIRPGGAGAYVLTTDATGGGQVGSFTPTATSGNTAILGSKDAATKWLACTIARTQVYRVGLNPDQARAVLDSLTEYYQLS